MLCWMNSWCFHIKNMLTWHRDDLPRAWPITDVSFKLVVSTHNVLKFVQNINNHMPHCTPLPKIWINQLCKIAYRKWHCFCWKKNACHVCDLISWLYYSALWLPTWSAYSLQTRGPHSFLLLCPTQPLSAETGRCQGRVSFAFKGQKLLVRLALFFVLPTSWILSNNIYLTIGIFGLLFGEVEWNPSALEKS